MESELPDPFWLLSDLAEQSSGAAIVARALTQSSALWSGLGYRVGELLMMTPIHEIHEIISYPKVRKIPGVVEWFKGIATSHGELLAISDIQGMLTGQLQPLTTKTRVLVVPWAGQLSGYLVSGMEGLQQYGQDDPTTIPLESVYRKYLRGTRAFNGGTWLQLSLRAVAASSEFNRIAV